MPVLVGWQFFILDGGSGVVFADEDGQKVGTPTVSVAVMAPPPARMCQWSDMPKSRPDYRCGSRQSGRAWCRRLPWVTCGRWQRGC